MRKTLRWTRQPEMRFPKISRLPRGNLLDRPDRRNVRTEQYLETRPRRCRHQPQSQRKTPRSRKARRRSGISRQSATTEVRRHRTSDTDHPLEAGATEAIEEEDLLGDIRGRVARVRLPNEDGDTRDRPRGTADTPCPGAGVAPGTIVTDLPAGDPRHPRRDVERPILDVDRAQRGDNNVGGPDHDPP